MDDPLGTPDPSFSTRIFKTWRNHRDDLRILGGTPPGTYTVTYRQSSWKTAPKTKTVVVTVR